MSTDIFRGQSVAVLSGGTQVVVKNKPGRIGRINVTVATTAAVGVYDDNQTPAGGPPLWAIVSPALGRQFDLDIPCSKGIVVAWGPSGQALMTYS